MPNMQSGESERLREEDVSSFIFNSDNKSIVSFN